MSFIFGFILGVVVALIGCAIRLAFLADAWFGNKTQGSNGDAPQGDKPPHPLNPPPKHP